MANIQFWLGMLHRAGLKRNDKLLVGNIDSGKAEYIDVAEILNALTADDLQEGANNKFLSPTLKQKLIDLSAANYTLEQLQGYFYPKTGNPDGFLTATSALASAKLTGIIAASLIPGLSADKITAGILSAARIPNLDASKINAGTFDIARIPQIPASKLENFALTLSDYILKSAIGAANGVTPLDANILIPTGYIPGMDAAKIISGIFPEERIPDVYIKLADIVDNLLSTDPSKVASANQIRVLNEKIDGLAGAKYKGTYPTFAALVFEYPEDELAEWHNNLGGWSADVDLGVDEKTQMYLWDKTDFVWVKQLGEANAETGVSIEQKYEALPDTNKFQDAHKAKVESLPAVVESTTGAQTKANAAQAAAEAYAAAEDADLQLHINTNEDNIAVHELRLATAETTVADHGGRLSTIELWIANHGPWQNRYQTISEMLNSQNDQNQGKKQWVFDASTDATVNSGWAVYELLDNTTKTANLTDYRKLSEQESMDAAATGNDWEVNITPTGTINGSNRIFTLPEPYMAGKLKVFRNGILQKPGVDYNEVSSTSFEFVEAPVVDEDGAEIILTEYKPQ